MASSARRAQARESIANPRWQSARVCGSGQVRSGHAPSSTGQTREVLGSHHQRPCPSTPSKGAPKPVLLALCKHPCERHLCGGRQRPHPRRGAGPPGGTASLPPQPLHISPLSPPRAPQRRRRAARTAAPQLAPYLADQRPGALVPQEDWRAVLDPLDLGEEVPRRAEELLVDAFRLAREA